MLDVVFVVYSCSHASLGECAGGPAAKDEVEEEKVAEAVTSVSEVRSCENFRLFILCLCAHRERHIDFVRAIQSEVPATSKDEIEDKAAEAAISVSEVKISVVHVVPFC
jgi:hypothetical protein